MARLNRAKSFVNQPVTEGFDASNNNFIGDYNRQASIASVTPIFVGDGMRGGD
jgi:hypothetical protein